VNDKHINNKKGLGKKHIRMQEFESFKETTIKNSFINMDIRKKQKTERAIKLYLKKKKIKLKIEN